MDSVAVIQQIAPEAVAGSTGTAVRTDAETASAVEKDGLKVAVPTDAADGITLAAGGAPALTIGLPFGDKASDATESQVPGVVVYDNHNGSSTVPVIRDSGVQINTVIDNANAPKRYAYPMDLAGGQSLQLNPDGSVIAAGADGTLSAFVAAPWAKDAKGNPVPTHYEVEGDTLVQVIDFTEATAFPVVTDPQFEWYMAIPTVKTTRAETRELMGLGGGPSGPGGAAKACGALLKVAGPAGIAAAGLCAINIVSIMYNATNAYNSGQCARLLIGPGVIGTIPYKDSYCR
ncbi:hypothetical protein [Leifsonia sp. EB34]|uniref:hypothetical protein n=1 Tax=Leifsonia sp. EB34 TaxID=3156303 RepID=UPI003519B8E0